ncbi:MAG: M48 family metallopeptidase [Oscillospiraceae bacterium]|nr:M48 family metallopeptidase [Oscillospiraceae bacterium]
MDFQHDMPDLYDDLSERNPEPVLPEQPSPAPEMPVPVQEPPAPVPPDDLPPVYASDFERMMALPPISKQEAETCRHRLEKRWYRRLIELNIFLILFVLIAIAVNTDSYTKSIGEFFETAIEISSETEDTEEAKKQMKDKYEDMLEDIPIEIEMLFYGLMLMTVGFLGLYTLQASVKAQSVKITQRNFPEIYQLIFSFAQRLGMQKVPDAYIVQSGGILNAFSAFIPHRQYIQINTEVFEVAYREHKDLNALAFIIAHEISHIYYGHATMHYYVPIWFSMNFPLFSAIASRTREYSCDRLAQRLTNYDGLEAIIMLMVDRHLYKMVDKQDYFDQTAQDGGFFLWLNNLLATHPIMPKRLRALAMWFGSGELY